MATGDGGVVFACNRFVLVLTSIENCCEFREEIFLCFDCFRLFGESGAELLHEDGFELESNSILKLNLL